MMLWQPLRFLSCILVILISSLLLQEGVCQISKEVFPAPASPLTTAAQIRRLTADEAAVGKPARLRGVVTVVDPDRTIFLQDSTGGTFIHLGKYNLPHIKSGQEIEVEGVTYPGLYLPGIEPDQVEILGPRELPAPLPVTMEELSSGHHNYEWVQVSGIIRSVRTDAERTILLLASGGGRLEIHAPGEMSTGPLVDATVLVSGLAAGFINDKRQLVAPHLRIRDLSDILVTTPAPASAFAQTPIPVTDLLRFSPEQRPGHRVKVRGVVTLQELGRAIFLRDGEQGLYIETTQSTVVRPGDIVEVLGFPEMGRFSAYLQDASFAVVAGESPPRPVKTNVTELLQGTHDGDLVSLQAQLIRVLGILGEGALLMQSGETVFRARAAFPDKQFTSLRIGSVLQLTGICQVAEADHQSVGFRSSPRSFELLLRSPDDVVLVHAAPWWNAQRLAFAAGILLLATVIALAWAALLRHQVRRQTALLRNKVEAEIVFEERQRLAREFHDTLEQELVGLSLRLDALATRISEPKPRELLNSTRRLLQRLQTEARSLVWDLREHPSVRGDFATAIQQSTRSVGDNVSVDVRVLGDTSDLSEITQHHLVRIAQEAVTNAVKHGGASTIGIALAVTQDNTRLTIKDNGSGFDIRSGTVAPPGHFGLVGMRERARKVSGELEIHSTPGEGAIVQVMLPHCDAAKPALPSTSLIG